MSWTETFPVMDADLVDEFEELATREERAELEEWYAVEKVFNRQDEKRHIVSFSLFWKPMQAADPDFPEPTEDRLKRAKELGLPTRFNPWDHYVQPLLTGAPVLREKFPDVVVRVHVASDLEFLIPRLVEAGCEVWWMRHPSLRFAPGGLWRLLPFGEEGRLATMADTDRMADLPADIARTIAMERAGLGAWRVAVPVDTAEDGGMHYRPFIGSQMGVKGGWPMQQLLQAFTWHMRRGTIATMADLPGCGLRPIPWASWPNHYFDEWFLAVAFYPRAAGAGLLTFAPSGSKSDMLTLDVEYCTWANPNSQLVFFRSASCCGPKAENTVTRKEADPAYAGLDGERFRVVSPEEKVESMNV